MIIFIGLHGGQATPIVGLVGRGVGVSWPVDEAVRFRDQQGCGVGNISVGSSSDSRGCFASFFGSGSGSGSEEHFIPESVWDIATALSPGRSKMHRLRFSSGSDSVRCFGVFFGSGFGLAPAPAPAPTQKIESAFA